MQGIRTACQGVIEQAAAARCLPMTDHPPAAQLILPKLNVDPSNRISRIARGCRRRAESVIAVGVRLLSHNGGLS